MSKKAPIAVTIIEVHVGDTTLRLTPEEARDLHRALEGVIGAERAPVHPFWGPPTYSWIGPDKFSVPTVVIPDNATLPPKPQIWCTAGEGEVQP